MSVLPFLDLRQATRSDLTRDAVAALTVTFMSVPQGVAYAMIAGLPPAMGLYAACIPTIVGALFRSSRHVITGPSNALSLLVGEGLAAQAGLDPVGTALLLALLIGGMQILAGSLRLGVLVDYISMPVVLGYITGAGVLIGIGQLPNLTQTAGGSGHIAAKVGEWASHLGGVNTAAIVMGLACAAAILALRKISRRLPGPILVLSAATLASFFLGLGESGLTTVGDIAPVPRGLPPLSIPVTGNWSVILSLAVAGTVLSLVESSSVARSVSAQTGQRLALSTEFVGQGLANVAAAFTGGYPTSGSLARTSLNVSSGARTRFAGILNGLLVLAVLLFLGPAVDVTPVAALAGLLLVVAVDLVDLGEIRRVVAGRTADSLAFAATLCGTWILPLDKAIYLGVAISIVMFLRRARLLVMRSTEVGQSGRMREIELDEIEESATCTAVRVLHVEGQLFFASANELQSVLDEMVLDTRIKVIVLRVKRAHGLDHTTLAVLLRIAKRLREADRHLFLVGMRPRMMAILERTGAANDFGHDHLFPTEPFWFKAMNSALKRGHELSGEHACRAEGCPLTPYLAAVAGAQASAEAGSDAKTS